MVDPVAVENSVVIGSTKVGKNRLRRLAYGIAGLALILGAVWLVLARMLHQQDLDRELVLQLEATSVVRKQGEAALEADIRKLLDVGANPNASNSVFYEQKSSFERILELFLSKKERRPGTPAIVLAAQGNLRQPLIKLLVDRRAEVNVRDSAGYTALFASAKSGDVPTCRLLMDAGIDITAKSTLDATAFVDATQSGNLELAQLFVDRGANANEVGKYGITPLEGAVRSGNAILVRFLLDRGANAKSASQSIITGSLINYAKHFKHREIEAMLRKAGAQ
jgi:ankyrin repeat protein